MDISYNGVQVALFFSTRLTISEAGPAVTKYRLKVHGITLANPIAMKAAGGTLRIEPEFSTQMIIWAAKPIAFAWFGSKFLWDILWDAEFMVTCLRGHLPPPAVSLRWEVTPEGEHVCIREAA